MNDKPPLPGTFHTIAGPSVPERPRSESKPEASRELVKKYTLFRETIHPKEDVVYYPSCSLDVSPSMAFPKSRVIYVDISVEAIKKLRAAGYEAYRASATEELSDPPIAAYSPQQPVDVLILLNPVINPEVPIKTIPPGGHVLCNDYHRTASEVRKNKNFSLIGMIRRNPQTKELFFDREQLEDYWKEVDTEEEFKHAPFSFSVVYYKIAADIVRKVTGKTDNVLVEYKRLIALAKQQLSEQDPDGIQKKNSMTIHFIHWNGMANILISWPPSLAKKEQWTISSSSNVLLTMITMSSPL